MRLFGTCLLAVLVLVASRLSGQDVTAGTPFSNLGETYFDQAGMEFGFDIRGSGLPADGHSAIVGLRPDGSFTPDGSLQFRQGSAATLPASGSDQDAATFGFQSRARGGSASLRLNFGQAASQTRGLQSPNITSVPGARAYFSDTQQRPFVLGSQPVVGGFAESSRADLSVPGLATPSQGPGQSVLAERLERLKAEGATAGAATNGRTSAGTQPKQSVAAGAAGQSKLDSARQSSAGQPAASIAEIRRQQSVQQQFIDKEAWANLQLARQAMRDGQPQLARQYYQQASSRSSPDIRAQAIVGLRLASGSRLATTHADARQSAPSGAEPPSQGIDPTNPFGAKLTRYGVEAVGN
jgi:hypothetical protein